MTKVEDRHEALDMGSAEMREAHFLIESAFAERPEHGEDSKLLNYSLDLYAVADGAGGAGGNPAAASESAINGLNKYYEQRASQPESVEDAITDMMIAFDVARDSTNSHGESGSTTLIAVKMEEIDGHLYGIWGNAGDSPLFLRKADGEIIAVSSEQSDLPGKGKKKNQIYNWLGQGNGSSEDEYGFIELKDGDRLILCSDGITGDWDGEIVYDPSIDEEVQMPFQRLTDAEMAGASSPSTAQESADWFLEFSLPKKRDDKTVVVVDIKVPETKAEPKVMVDYSPLDDPAYWPVVEPTTKPEAVRANIDAIDSQKQVTAESNPIVTENLEQPELHEQKVTLYDQLAAAGYYIKDAQANNDKEKMRFGIRQSRELFAQIAQLEGWRGADLEDAAKRFERNFGYSPNQPRREKIIDSLHTRWAQIREGASRLNDTVEYRVGALYGLPSTISEKLAAKLTGNSEEDLRVIGRNRMMGAAALGLTVIGLSALGVYMSRRGVTMPSGRGANDVANNLVPTHTPSGRGMQTMLEATPSPSPRATHTATEVMATPSPSSTQTAREVTTAAPIPRPSPAATEAVTGSGPTRPTSNPLTGFDHQPRPSANHLPVGHDSFEVPTTPGSGGASREYVLNLNVDRGRGIEDALNKLGLNDQQASRAFKELRPFIEGQQGITNVGNDLWVNNPGPLPLRFQMTQELEQILRANGLLEALESVA